MKQQFFCLLCGIFFLVRSQSLSSSDFECVAGLCSFLYVLAVAFLVLAMCFLFPSLLAFPGTQFLWFLFKFHIFKEFLMEPYQPFTLLLNSLPFQLVSFRNSSSLVCFPVPSPKKVCQFLKFLCNLWCLLCYCPYWRKLHDFWSDLLSHNLK